jgi:hypothetical protein
MFIGRIEYLIDGITTRGITNLKHASSTRHRAAMPIRFEAVSNCLYSIPNYLLYNIAATTPNPRIAAKLSTTVFPAAPVNSGMPAEFVALPG